ncbi:MAG: ATP-binding cassette domain-containing protein, partial [Synergistaceae bacterium]|nr:ATP-binding cassette domain-containing protein [Synergistaceae bacterium]
MSGKILLKAEHIDKRFGITHAVNDVSIDVYAGEIRALIGENGSGKSTLLKMVTGVLTPTSGTLKVNGKIAAILELGAGFNMEYTGRENI